MKSKKKKIIIIFSSILLIFVSLIILSRITISLMEKDVMPVVDSVERAILNDKDIYLMKSFYDDYVKDGWDFSNYNVVVVPDDEWYEVRDTNINCHFNNRIKVTYDDWNPYVEVKLIATRHNFSHGYIWLEYTDIDGTVGSSNIPVKMEIQKENGEWKVIRIWEEP